MLHEKATSMKLPKDSTDHEHSIDAQASPFSFSKSNKVVVTSSRLLVISELRPIATKKGKWNIILPNHTLKQIKAILAINLWLEIPFGLNLL